MKNTFLIFSFLLAFLSCQTTNEWNAYNETSEILENKKHPIDRMQFKLIQSKYNDKNAWLKPFEKELKNFTELNYTNLKEIIIEKDIPTIQKFIISGELTYEELTLFYLYRIKKIEFNKDLYLNSIISLNPDILNQAREKDKKKPKSIYSLYGIPILLKDNINYKGISTTAGSVALIDNNAEDAYVVKKLKENGAIILGKTNLSEWAYYFCNNCPLGYSAIGGQTLNPYGRKKFESGGSSSGSGVAISSNFSSVALGSETSGSILSPASLNSIVGLKPTIGLVSRTGIVPISSTLDTSGPMTKNVIDNIIVFNAITGFDKDDSFSVSKNKIEMETVLNSTLKNKRFGVFKNLLDEPLYAEAIEQIKKEGGLIFEFTPPEINYNGFRKILDVDMKKDLPKYLNKYSKNSIKNIKEIIDFNIEDSLKRAPYGQGIFKSIALNNTTDLEISEIKSRIKLEGKRYFDEAINKYDLDAVLSINNYHASYAAGAYYPCLTVPMGYRESGVPSNLTFIGPSYSEEKLYQLGYAFEKETNKRVSPFN
jgi:amidase|tara:strand:- start:1902 stop:3518 length:1617 start_codon:yes stop_codon:yes gene_type:complete